MSLSSKSPILATLEWYLDHGVDVALETSPQNRLLQTPPRLAPDEKIENKDRLAVTSLPALPAQAALQGLNELRQKAVLSLIDIQTLEELQNAIIHFDGLAIRKTATKMVFADGVSTARIMVIGEAPGADEDIKGVPFVGPAGQLLDKMLQSIGLDRKKNVYISNVLNWRPPGNRTPQPAEIELSTPFLEKHILLIKPDFILSLGATAARALLHNFESMNKIRGKWQSWSPKTAEFQKSDPELRIPVLPSYHPSYLLRTPSAKRQSWMDLLSLKEKIGPDL